MAPRSGQCRAKLRTFAVVAVAGMAFAGCDVLGITTNCTTELVWGVSLTLEDSTTGGRLNTPAITVKAVDGGYIEEMTVDPDPPNPGPVTIISDRPGTYAITVLAEGYEMWHLDNVRVRQNGCHVSTVPLVARLVPRST